MEPKLSFTIRSIHEDIALDCRLFYSSSVPASRRGEKLQGIIIAHPYAPLGGCYDDPVVNLIVEESLKASHGFICTFNFRGASGSAGRTSWTGKAERADLTSVVAFMLWFLHNYASDAATPGENTDHNDPAIQLIIGGYSYGSWICCHLLDVENLWREDFDAHPGTAAAEIRTQAHVLAAHCLALCGAPGSKSRDVSSSLSGREIEDPARKGSKTARRPSVEVAYLFISPVLPPASSFITLPFGVGALKQLGDDQLEVLSSHKTLTLFGNDDIFTSGDKLRRWAQSIASRPASKFTYLEVAGAGHFWRSQTAQKALRNAVREWLLKLDGASLP